uniref:RING finger and transmembrane domain-containing protein 2-like n=1 Tax=Oncorhynchus gorbuscha TaxID=8017 RepID=UPI001EAF0EAB
PSPPGRKGVHTTLRVGNTSPARPRNFITTSHSSTVPPSAAGAIERHGNRKVVSEEPSTLAPAISDLKSVVTWLQREFPFLLILLNKVCFQHKLGIAVCWDGQHVSFANSTFKHLVSLREERSVVVALWMIMLLSRKILYLYYTFNAAQLYNRHMSPCDYVSSQCLQSPKSTALTSLIWAMGITDFVLKYFTIGPVSAQDPPWPLNQCRLTSVDEYQPYAGLWKFSAVLRSNRPVFIHLIPYPPEARGE